MFSVVQTFGLFLALAFLCSAYFLKLELSRKYQEGVIGKLKHSSSGYLDDFINSVLLILISSKAFYAAFNFDEVSGHMGDFLLSKKGYWAAGLILAGVLVAWQYFREKKSEKKDTVTYVNPTLKVTDITMAAALFGILGAKIFAIFESADTLKHFMNDPIGSFFSGSGLAIYGGLIIAFFGVNLYVKSIGLYTTAVDALGVDPAHAVALEDSHHGTVAAKAAGLACVAVPNRVTAGQDFRAASLVVDSLEHVTLPLLEDLLAT